jgi:hypothetical protein
VYWALSLGASLIDSAPAQSSTIELPQIVVNAASRQTERTSPPATTPSTAAQQPQIPVSAPTQPENPPPQAASEEVISGAEVNAIPVSRPGEILEAAPGLVVTQHSGEGKANQYFLRGYNLDHGTDLAITVDGMPVNMRTHGHGQGYADINFLIPELVSSMLVRKGPYYADEGDFSSAGAIHIDYARKLDRNLVEGTVGSFGYRRGLAAASMPAFAGTMLVAAEGSTYNGPWDVPDNLRKLNGVVRYSQGTAADGFTLTGMAYANRWTSTDQVAQRAIDTGLIGRLGSLDSTDGGQASRFSLSGHWAQTSAIGASVVDAFAINSSLTLFNNFTYFLHDPVHGDQFSQTDRRNVFGINASHSFKTRFGDLDTESRIGVQTRYDDIDVGLFKTLQRTTLSTVRDDSVQEGSVGIWADTTTHWTDWLRTTVGIRQDWFSGQVASDTALNSGSTDANITSPKFGVVLGPWAKTELFGNYGYGFHSNDLRGTTITVDPNDKVSPQVRVPLLVRTKGAEVGARTKIVGGLTSSVALFVLDQASELLFVGDAGTTEASRPSRRVGVEWTNNYKISSWIGIDVDVAYSRARFTDFDPVGNFIPGAPAWVGSAAITLGEETGWFGAVKGRYFGPRPLIEDASVRSLASFIVNARVGYKWENGVRIQLDAFNLFNANTNQIEYFYASRLPGESVVSVEDRHVHPVEPLAVRMTLAAQF